MLKGSWILWKRVLVGRVGKCHVAVGKYHVAGGNMLEAWSVADLHRTLERAVNSLKSTYITDHDL